jgi:hypothetical protein
MASWKALKQISELYLFTLSNPKSAGGRYEIISEQIVILTLIRIAGGIYDY